MYIFKVGNMLDFKEFLSEANKISANRGDVAEIILGAAVTARFYNAPQVSTKISKPDVYEMITKVLRSQDVTLKDKTNYLVQLK